MRKIIDSSCNNQIDGSIIEYLKNIRPYGVILLVINILAILTVLSITILQPLVFQNKDSAIEKLPIKLLGDEIEVNALSELDGYSKDQVYNLRKRYIFRSMFKSDSYNPNEKIFGGIEDGKYWYGTENLICYDGSKSPLLRAEGDSYVSRLINNPSLLIGLDLPYVWNTKEPQKYNVCHNKKILFIPEAISYSKEYNMITAEFKINRNVLSNKRFYMLNGLNARDLGYSYGYVYDTKNVNFKDKNAVDKKVYEFRDYLAVGYSCKIDGGCNNLCPMQNKMMFQFLARPAVINFKLWKEKPKTVFDKPDIYYRMIFTR